MHRTSLGSIIVPKDANGPRSTGSGSESEKKIPIRSENGPSSQIQIHWYPFLIQIQWIHLQLQLYLKRWEKNRKVIFLSLLKRRKREYKNRKIKNQLWVKTLRFVAVPHQVHQFAPLRWSFATSVIISWLHFEDVDSGWSKIMLICSLIFTPETNTLYSFAACHRLDHASSFNSKMMASDGCHV